MCGGLEEKYDLRVDLIEFKSKSSGGGRTLSVGRGVAGSGWESGTRSLDAEDVGGRGAVGRGGVWRFEGGAFSLLLLLGGKEPLGSCEEGDDDGCEELKDAASSGGIFGIGNS